MFLTLCVAALAQDVGFDAHGFVLTANDGDLRDPLTVDRPGPWAQGDWWFSGLLEYADQPLVQVVAPSLGNDPPTETVIVDQLFGLNLNTGVGLHRNVRLDLTAPVFFTSFGPDGYRDPAFGDLRFTGMYAILRPPHLTSGGGPGVGVSAHLDVPTGDAEAFLGQPGVAGGFAFSGTWEASKFTVTGELGAQFNPAAELQNLANADQLLAGAAFNVLPAPGTGLTLETRLAAPLQAAEVAGTALPAELLLSIRQRLPAEMTFTLGGATAISQGASAARFRAFAGLSFGRVAPAREPDIDAVVEPNVQDKCPNAPETPNGWKDDDGCPDELGTMAIRATWKGKDVDDVDLVVTQISATAPAGEQRFRGSDRPSLPAVPGERFRAVASAPALCLSGDASLTAGESFNELQVQLQQTLPSWVEVEVKDSSGAPIANPVVRWSSTVAPSCLPDAPVAAAGGGNVVRTPAGAGRHHVLVEVPGYKLQEQDVDVPPQGTRIVVTLEPSRVVLEKTRIAILDKVFFETNRAAIKPASFVLLDDVAAVILAHPEVGRVQVEGHTDDQGNDAYNLKLSQSRAEAVRDYLVRHGVPPERLVALGFGETVPIETNRTDAGRAVNRRVEFNLVDSSGANTSGSNSSGSNSSGANTNGASTSGQETKP